MENNEWSFCSLWTDHIILEDAEALINTKFAGDYFFNRARLLLAEKDFQQQLFPIKHIAEVFWTWGLDCHLYDRSDRFRENKYMSLLDTMYVLQRPRDIAKATDTPVVLVDESSVPIWIDIFCKSFSVHEWRAEVTTIITKNLNKIILLLSLDENLPSGCAILYRTGGITGVYCLGTLAEKRGRGIATSILRKAASMSGGLSLQTLKSDGLLEWYQRKGFSVAYAKRIYLIRKPYFRTERYDTFANQ
jgi:hypothetical protein